MATPLSLTSSQFSDALTSESLQVTRLVHAAIMMGPVVFFMVVLAFSFQQSGGPPPRASDFEVMNILSVVNALLFVMALFLTQFLSGFLFSPDRLGQDTGSITAEMLASQCVSMQRTADIGRIAALEGAALFGLAVCFIGATNNVLQADPSYWLNALSTGLFVGYGITTFPTKQNLIDWFETRFVRT